VLQTLGPAPSGENTKKKQLEYDGLGRLTSVCEITSVSGSGSCVQSSGSPIGFWTKYSYDTLGNLTGVTQNAQASAGSQQSRTFAYDMLGRLTSETNPESGTSSYLYDSLTSDASCGTISAPGNLVKKADAMGNVTCLTYDTLHRITSMTYPTGPYASTMAKRFYIYDSATVNGATMANVKTRLAEAYTCTTCPGTKITDLGFSYSARGELVDVYQSSPHSAGYYHTTAAYYPNGALNSLSGVPGQSAWTFGVDAEGRANSATQGATSLVTSVAFDTASQPRTISFAQGDSDSYEYDPNTGRMTKYTFTVGSTPQSMVGVLTWNSNGTLSKLAITDGFNASGAQTCKYGDPTASVAGYDDLGRLIKVDCGLSMWQQNFSYDAFGNITKNVPPGAAGINWIPGYSSATNRYTLGGTTYDLDGNLTNDSFHTHWWNPEGKIASIGSATCGGSGVICLTYDALGRVVERQNGAAFTEFLYSPIGKTAVMTGQTLTNATIPLPGGTRLYYATATNKQLWHKDWLGSARVVSSFSSRTIVADRAVAPFGEPYNVVTGGGPGMFAENEQAIFAVSGSASQPYDTPNRELHPTQGRWISPDPAGASAVDLRYPQTWNRYAYVENMPSNFTDRSGLCDDIVLGFTDTPGEDLQNVEALAGQIGANIAYPFSGLDPESSYFAAQFGSLGKTVTRNSILNSYRQSVANGNPRFRIFAYSGGGEEVADVWSSLPPEVQANAAVIAISPGRVPFGSQLPADTTIYQAFGPIDAIATMLSPSGTDLLCTHDANCEFGQIADKIQNGATSPCTNQDVFTRQSPKGTKPGNGGHGGSGGGGGGTRGFPGSGPGGRGGGSGKDNPICYNPWDEIAHCT